MAVDRQREGEMNEETKRLVGESPKTRKESKSERERERLGERRL